MENQFTEMANEQLMQRILLCMQNGDKVALAELLEDQVRTNPESSTFALLFVAAKLAQSEQYAEAIPLYMQALRLSPENPSIYFYLGLAYHALNMNPECLRIWDELPKRFPEHGLTDYQAALRMIDAGNVSEAVLLLQRAVKKVDERSPLRLQIQSTLNKVTA